MKEKRPYLDKFDHAVIKMAKDLKTEGTTIPETVYFVKTGEEFTHVRVLRDSEIPKGSVIYSIKRPIIEQLLADVKKYNLK